MLANQIWNLIDLQKKFKNADIWQEKKVKWDFCLRFDAFND